MSVKRCNWSKLEHSKTYREYHDFEWGVASYEDEYLFEMLVLESFHCGLSWLIILNKRAAFKNAFDQFDPYVIKDYGLDKIKELSENKAIVRNLAKIKATISNAAAFIKVKEEFGSFSKYIWSFTNNQIIYNEDDILRTTSDLSDKVSKDFKKRGFKFMGSVTTYSYLEAIGVLNNHSLECFRSKFNQK
ncbi:MAG: DNA-3-methyladenine glycosylase I [Tenericutes bacterium]|nr:DNA-3-methyladenine glycosylase I [Mycoplasmatota bacterium]